MKRFLIFGYDGYYPAGGCNDLVAMKDTLEEAVHEAEQNKFDNYHVLDVVEGAIVYSTDMEIKPQSVSDVIEQNNPNKFFHKQF